MGGSGVIDRGLNFFLPVPFTSGSRSVNSRSHIFVLFLFQTTLHCCKFL